ncbi:hypothetical protein J6590_026799 [Homalodisca vitripennis]|nr:hypothetical protein J6590_026799 [Homalodisca vitripennis]
MSANRATENSATDDEASDVDSESSGNTAVDSSGSDSEDIVINPSWANNTNGLRQIPFTGNNRLLVDVPGNGSPIDWFLMLTGVFYPQSSKLLSLLRQDTQPKNLYKMKNGIKRVTENVNQDFVLSTVLTYITEASSKSHALKTL